MELELEEELDVVLEDELDDVELEDELDVLLDEELDVVLEDELDDVELEEDVEEELEELLDTVLFTNVQVTTSPPFKCTLAVRVPRFVVVFPFGSVQLSVVSVQPAFVDSVTL